MGKNNRKNVIPQQTAPAQRPHAMLNGLLTSADRLVKLVRAPKPAWSEQIFEELHTALPEERRVEFQELLNQFMQLGKEASQALERAEQQAAEHEAKLAALGNARAASDARSAELERLAATLAEREEACTGREAAQLKQAAELAVREENAAIGFLKERVEATGQLHAELEALATQRLGLQAELARISESSRQDLESKMAVQLQALRERQLALDEQAAEQEARAVRIESEQRILQRARRTGEEVEALVRRELEEEFASLRADDAASIGRLEQQVEQLCGDNDELNDQLDAYRDFEETLGGRSPDQVLDELDELRRKLNEHVRKIRELESAQSRDDSNAVRAERDELLEELRELRPELADLKQQSHRVQMGVMEKEHWEREKRMLQRGKELLEKGLVDLEGRIKGLTEDGQSQGVFPELCRMDGDVMLQLPAKGVHITDLKQFTEDLRDRIALSQPDNPLYFSLDDIQLFVGGLAMSQLHVFQGISGTGKTSLAKAFAKVVGGECTDIAVQAGWRDRSDLLGHYNAFEKRYYEKDALQALYRARTPALSDRINVILLDEMNLSRPEQYFADFLSALEKAPHDRAIPLMESRPPHAPKLLQEGRTILLPQNVWFIGTANQDETTNELADKTHDRAFVMELRSRHKGQHFEPRKLGPNQPNYSFDSLKTAFEKARHAHGREVQEVLEYLDASQLTRVLEERFGQGWGNRLERQALQFLPVVKATGGSFETALDHLLATRMFRAGKVTGRYDVDADDLLAVEQALQATWKDMSLCGTPERCLLAIEKDIKRRERGG